MNPATIIKYRDTPSMMKLHPTLLAITQTLADAECLVRKIEGKGHCSAIESVIAQIKRIEGEIYVRYEFITDYKTALESSDFINLQGEFLAAINEISGISYQVNDMIANVELEGYMRYLRVLDASSLQRSRRQVEQMWLELYALVEAG